MSRSLNRAMLIGNVGADPEVRTTSSGARVASFSLATSRRWATRSGQEQEKTEWHRIVAWDRLVEIVERYVRKGDRLYVEGRLEYRSWEDASGQTRYASEVIAQELILLGGAGAGSPERAGTRGGEASPGRAGRSRPPAGTETGPTQRAAFEEDDLPF